MCDSLFEFPKESVLLADRIRRFSISFFEKAGYLFCPTPILSPPSGEHYNSTLSLSVNGIPTMLADSPQVYKMMLIMAGLPKYYQIAHCFRPIKEEGSPDRLTEFTQIDVEIGKADLDMLCGCAIDFVTSLAADCGRSVRVKVMDGMACRDTFGPEMKPNLPHVRDELLVVLIKRLPLISFDGSPHAVPTPCHHIFAKPSVNILETGDLDLSQITTDSFDIVINGIEVGGGDMRINDEKLQKKMMSLFHVETGCYSNYLRMLEKRGLRLGGGFAFGLERLVMVLSGGDRLSDVMPFADYYLNRVW